MKSVVHVMILMLVAGLGTALAERANYGGEWKLNVEKSDFGMAPAVSNRTDKIVHKDPSLQITRAQTTPLAARVRTSIFGRGAIWANSAAVCRKRKSYAVNARRPGNRRR